MNKLIFTGIILSILVPIFLITLFFHDCNTSCFQGGGYFTKWWSAYYQGKGVDVSEIKIKGVDLDTFEVIDSIYAKDKNHFYFLGKIIEGVDVKTAKLLDYPFLKDKDHVYFRGKMMPKVDVQTFQTLSGYYAKDKNHVYAGTVLGAEIIKDADPETFKFVGKETLIHDYAKDKNYAYYQGEKIPESHGPTFEVLENGYSKDKNHVYHLDYLPQAEYKYKVSIVEEADPKTFKP